MPPPPAHHHHHRRRARGRARVTQVTRRCLQRNWLHAGWRAAVQLLEFRHMTHQMPCSCGRRYQHRMSSPCCGARPSETTETRQLGGLERGLSCYKTRSTNTHVACLLLVRGTADGGIDQCPLPLVLTRYALAHGGHRRLGAAGGGRRAGGEGAAAPGWTGPRSQGTGRRRAACTPMRRARHGICLGQDLWVSCLVNGSIA